MSTQAQSQAGGVGALLKQSREQRGLTTAEVASQLRLKVSLIEQIEAEQWDPAVSATFIRGYLRAYAKLLKLPEHEILANFELQAAYLRHQAKPMHSFSNKASLEAVDNRFMLASYLLIVLLIGLFLVWFWQTHLIDAEPVTALPELSVTESTSDAATTAVENTTTLNSEVTPKPATPAAELNTAELAKADVENSAPEKPALANPELEKPEPDTAKPDARASNAQTLPATAADNHPLAAETATSPAADSAVTTAAPEPQQQAQTATAGDTTTAGGTAAHTTATAENNTANPVANTASDTAVGNSMLRLQFSAECWLEVTDATGKRLAYGTRQAGQNDVLTGTAPFKVLLGNAAAAKVQLNDVAVDLSGYAAGRVARLTLGGQP